MTEYEMYAIQPEDGDTIQLVDGRVINIESVRRLAEQHRRQREEDQAN